MSPHGYGDIEAEAVERITEWIVTTTNEPVIERVTLAAGIARPP
jgi:hypothetical protein